MSPVLHFDIIALIIDIIGEDEDTNLLKQLALVSHSFHQISTKHQFATIKLHDSYSKRHVASSKRGFVKLLESRPEVVKYIRKLTYEVTYDPPINSDLQLSPILPNFLRTISCLDCLTITATGSNMLDWNKMDSSLTSAFLYLMHLPTIIHIDLSFIDDFPLSSLTESVNLRRLDISQMKRFSLAFGVYNPIETVAQSMPKIREFHTSESHYLTTKLLHAKRQDGGPAFNFMDLKRLSISSTCFEDERNIRYLLQNAKLLEELHLSVGHGRSLVGLHDILPPSARTLKVLGLKVYLYDDQLYLAGICEELEAMAGDNMLEVLSFEIFIGVFGTMDFQPYKPF
jgi:hypothetical protein